MERREFIKLSLTAAGGLSLGFYLPGPRAAAAAPAFAPNAWLRIDPDNRITFICPQNEMGQDVHTSLAMLVAEELGGAGEQPVSGAGARRPGVQERDAGRPAHRWLDLRPPRLAAPAPGRGRGARPVRRGGGENLDGGCGNARHRCRPCDGPGRQAAVLRRAGRDRRHPAGARAGQGAAQGARVLHADREGGTDGASTRRPSCAATGSSASMRSSPAWCTPPWPSAR